jgi:hypothetical protein
VNVECGGVSNTSETRSRHPISKGSSKDTGQFGWGVVPEQIGMSGSHERGDYRSLVVDIVTRRNNIYSNVEPHQRLPFE